MEIYINQNATNLSFLYKPYEIFNSHTGLETRIEVKKQKSQKSYTSEARLNSKSCKS